MNYKDAKIRLCPICGKNKKECYCKKEEQNQKKTVKFVQLSQKKFDQIHNP